MAYEVHINRGTTYWLVYEPLIHDSILPIRFMTIIAPLFLTVLIGIGGEIAEFIQKQNKKDKRKFAKTLG